jgi:hypothetical protein
MLVNKALVQRTVSAKLVRDEKLRKKTKLDILIGKYVLIRDESLRKFKLNWFRLYKVILAALIGTYGLQDYYSSVLRSLINR